VSIPIATVTEPIEEFVATHPEFANYYWVHCFSCGMPMYGMPEKTPQNMTRTCSACGVKNVFKNSHQPVGVQSCDFQEVSLSTRTGNKGKTLERQLRTD